MIDYNALFYVGNRRSGTTLLDDFLNEHPNIYVAHEADIVWLLYLEGDYRTHPDERRVWRKEDNLTGDAETRHPDYLSYDRLEGNIREKFAQDILYIKDHGAAKRQIAYPEKRKEDILWLGDKKPATACDPNLRAYYEINWPEAKYLHIVRDPRHCIASMAGLNWCSGDMDRLINLWCDLEERALEVEPRIFLRYENLCTNPGLHMRIVCEHLDLDYSMFEQVHKGTSYPMKRGAVHGIDYALEARSSVKPNEVPITNRMRKLMDLYGYE